MSRGFRPEVQALRALAVTLVVLFHLWPERLTGGYVGVDVFFVISGYLITAHLVRELRDSGTVRLGRFYARRIRRLLPAAFLVLAVALVGVLAFVPRLDWGSMLRDIWSSAVYAVNWVLASSSVDYFAAEEAASPVQHYWSLSVEEQFYILWPLLLIVAWRLRKRTALLGLFGVIFLASFAYSVYGSIHFQEFAYFATPSHAWEFAVGGLMALLLPRDGFRDGWWLTASSWIGWVAIAASAVLFDADTLFPGWVALLPVLGTVLVIASGVPKGVWSPSAVVGWRPVQFIGDISYSLYLWHWLPIVLLPYALQLWIGRDYLTGPEKIVVFVICVLLAWATKVFVEDPARKAPWLQRSSRTYLSATIATIILVAAALTPSFVLAQQRAAEAERLEAAYEAASGGADPCFGANAADAEEACDESNLITDTSSLPFLADDDEFAWVKRQAEDDVFYDASCSKSGIGNSVCAYGDQNAETRIALVGDSHAGHLIPAVLTAANKMGWAVDVWRMAECTPAVKAFPLDEPDKREECVAWRDTVIGDVADSGVDAVVTTSYTARYTRWMESHPENVTPLEDGFLQAWNQWQDAGISVLAVSDVPAWGENIPRCVNDAGAEVADPCAEPRDEVVFNDPLLGAAERAGDPDVAAVDLTDVFCDEETCHPVVGGLVVARDIGHLTATFSATLAPHFVVALDELMRARS